MAKRLTKTERQKYDEYKALIEKANRPDLKARPEGEWVGYYRLVQARIKREEKR